MRPEAAIRKPRKCRQLSDFIGERAGARTQDPLIKSQVLYRLSYALVPDAAEGAEVD
jgi:hypothetical protein